MVLILLNSNLLGFGYSDSNWMRRMAAKFHQHWWKSADDWVVRRWKIIVKPHQPTEAFLWMSHRVVSFVRTQPVFYRKSAWIEKLFRCIVRSLMSFNNSAGCHFESFRSISLEYYVWFSNFQFLVDVYDDDWAQMTMKYFRNWSTIVATAAVAATAEWILLLHTTKTAGKIQNENYSVRMGLMVMWIRFHGKPNALRNFEHMIFIGMGQNTMNAQVNF